MIEPRVPSLIQLGVSGQMSRRRAMQWVMAAMAASSVNGRSFADAVAGPTKQPGSQPAHDTTGYGPDAKLIAIHTPGDLWPLTFTDAQRKTATALADVIIPADHLGPAASEVGVVAMIDEWISAPYPQQQNDRPVIVDGLKWLDVESANRFANKFSDATDVQKHSICADICFTGSTKKEMLAHAHFFDRFRSLCAAAYYATPAGWQAIGYVGNVPLPGFDGPPAEVLEKLGVTQTVK